MANVSTAPNVPNVSAKAATPDLKESPLSAGKLSSADRGDFQMQGAGAPSSYFDAPEQTKPVGAALNKPTQSNIPNLDTQAAPAINTTPIHLASLRFKDERDGHILPASANTRKDVRAELAEVKAELVKMRSGKEEGVVISALSAIASLDAVLAEKPTNNRHDQRVQQYEYEEATAKLLPRLELLLKDRQG